MVYNIAAIAAANAMRQQNQQAENFDRISLAHSVSNDFELVITKYYEIPSFTVYISLSRTKSVPKHLTIPSSTLSRVAVFNIPDLAQTKIKQLDSYLETKLPECIHDERWCSLDISTVETYLDNIESIYGPEVREVVKSKVTYTPRYLYAVYSVAEKGVGPIPIRDGEFKDQEECSKPHGKWLWINQAKGYLEPPYGDTCKCSACGYVIDVSETNFKYCPECGTRMLGVSTGTIHRGE